jgi:multiple sugar transport system permease protein
MVTIVATVVIPAEVLVVPSYVIFSKIHWVGTFLPIIVPAFFGNGFSIFLLRQYFLTIPEHLCDMARLEGAGELGVLCRVIVPLARPAIIAVTLFNFVYVWNDFFIPLVYLGPTSHLWTLSLSLANFRTTHHVDWNLTMAASTLFAAPVLIIFLLAQRALMSSIALTGAARLR